MAPALPPALSYQLVQATSGTRNLLQLTVVETGLAGDYNHDGAVDAADNVLWRKTDGTQAGYDTWRAHFGRGPSEGWSVGNRPGISTDSFSHVPESASVILIVAGIIVAARRVSRTRP